MSTQTAPEVPACLQRQHVFVYDGVDPTLSTPHSIYVMSPGIEGDALDMFGRNNGRYFDIAQNNELVRQFLADAVRQGKPTPVKLSYGDGTHEVHISAYVIDDAVHWRISGAFPSILD